VADRQTLHVFPIASSLADVNGTPYSSAPNKGDSSTFHQNGVKLPVIRMSSSRHPRTTHGPQSFSDTGDDKNPLLKDLPTVESVKVLSCGALLHGKDRFDVDRAKQICNGGPNLSEKNAVNFS
jgi:hypothetical protein